MEGKKTDGRHSSPRKDDEDEEFLPSPIRKPLFDSKKSSSPEGRSSAEREKLETETVSEFLNAEDASPTTTVASTVLSESSVDWYGNSPLHHLLARRAHEVDLDLLLSLATREPALLLHRNRFGRIALHYALDRTRVCEPAVALYLHCAPSAAGVADEHGLTPYDLALKWGHGKRILRTLLAACPQLDRNAYLRLKYGPIGHVAVWARQFSQKVRVHPNSDGNSDRNLAAVYEDDGEGEREEGNGEEEEEEDDGDMNDLPLFNADAPQQGRDRVRSVLPLPSHSAESALTEMTEVLAFEDDSLTPLIDRLRTSSLYDE